MPYDRFAPAPFNKWERGLCWVVWISHSIAAFVTATYVSQVHLHTWIQPWLTNSSYINGARMDLTDSEWLYFRRTVNHMLLAYTLHNVLFYSTIRFVGPKWVKLVLGSLGILLQIQMTSLHCVLIVATFCAVVTSLSVLSRNVAIPWILCISFVLKGSDVVPFTMKDHVYYIEFTVYLYGAIKILNFSLYLCKDSNRGYGTLWLDHLIYMTYLPYSMTLIVLFDDFIIQLQRRLSDVEAHSIDLRFTGFFALRLFVWFFVFELFLHFIHVHSLYTSPFSILHHLNLYELAAVAYVVGQLFHVKYVVLFGLPALFAYLDGMRPPPPPICISRVSRYSKMWRHFDAGLYQFLKNQVYKPLLMVQLPPVLLVVRYLATLIAVFGVVLAWHGTKTHYVCWVSLSAAELIIERLGRALWSTSQFQHLRHFIGERNTRRLIAVAMLATVIPGIFGVFFFLGVEGTGTLIYKALLVDGMNDIITGNIELSSNCAGFVLIHLLILGYFFNNVCLEFETLHESRKHS